MEQSVYLNLYFEYKSITKKYHKIIKKHYIKKASSHYTIYKNTTKSNGIFLHQEGAPFTLDCRLGHNKNIIFCHQVIHNLDVLSIKDIIISIDAYPTQPPCPNEFIFYNFVHLTNKNLYVWDTSSLIAYHGKLREFFLIMDSLHFIPQIVYKELRCHAFYKKINENDSKSLKTRKQNCSIWAKTVLSFLNGLPPSDIHPILDNTIDFIKKHNKSFGIKNMTNDDYIIRYIKILSQIMKLMTSDVHVIVITEEKIWKSYIDNAGVLVSSPRELLLTEQQVF